MKNRIVLLVMAAAMTFIVSCKDDDDNIGNAGEPLEASAEIYDYQSLARYRNPTVIKGSLGKASATEIGYYLTNQKTVVDENTRLLFVSDLEDASFEELSLVYSNGGTIAIINPNKEKIDKFFEEKNWNGHSNDDDIEDAYLYSFNSNGDVFIITGLNDDDIDLDPNDLNDLNILKTHEFFSDNKSSDNSGIVESENGDSVVISSPSEEEVRARYLHEAFESFFEELNENETTNESSARRILTRASSIDSRVNINDLGKAHNVTKTYPFSKTVEYYQYSKYFTPDKMSGSGTFTVSLNYYTLHTYDDTDYYLCTADFSIANGSMYHGKGWNTHGSLGCRHTRWCGAICTDAKFQLEPIYREVSTYKSVTPESTEGKTSYKTDTSFSLDVKGSLGTSAGKKGDTSSKGVEGSLEVGLGWTWSESKSRDINDVNLSNLCSGSNVTYQLDFNNLPEFNTKEEYSIKEGNASAFKTTQYIHSSWVWKDHGISRSYDDSEIHGIILRVNLRANYKILHWFDIYTAKDEYTFNVSAQDEIELDAPNRARAGIIVLNNNSENTISNIRIYNKDNKLVYQNTRSYPKDKTISLGGYKIKNNQYTMKVKIGDSDYVYKNEANKNVIPLTNAEETVVYVQDDFEICK